MVLVVNVPTIYKDRKILDAISMGLFDLSIGKRPNPEEVPLGETVTARLKLSDKGERLWSQLLPSYHNNKRRLVREALTLVAQEPEQCWNCRI